MKTSDINGSENKTQICIGHVYTHPTLGNVKLVHIWEGFITVKNIFSGNFYKISRENHNLK